MATRTKPNDRNHDSLGEGAASAQAAQPRPAIAGTAPGRAAVKTLLAKPEALPGGLLVIGILLFWLWNSNFLTAVNLSGILAYTPELGLLALGMTMLLTAGQFDLSVGAVFGFTPLLVFILINNDGVPVPLAALIGVAVAAAIGFINGFVVTKLGISSFLVTLSTQLIVSGGAVYMSSGFPQSTASVNSWIRPLLVGSFTISGLRLYASLAWFLGIAIVLWYLLTQTRLGNWVMATGGNKEAARARGIASDRLTIGLFIFTSAVAGFAGMISDLRVGSAYPTAGTGYELQAIAMAVVGGTSLFGGTGTIIGTVLGAFLLLVIQNGVILAGVPGLAYPMFVGAIILLAMLLQVGLRRVSFSIGKAK
jgi:simple sugar transport system permease protein